MFWTASALSSTVGQTGPCTFNTNVQNATDADTYLNGSLEYLGWGLGWQESEKYVCVSWVFLQVKWNMGASCILLGAIGLFACCSPFGSNRTDSTTTNIQYQEKAELLCNCIQIPDGTTCDFFWQTSTLSASGSTFSTSWKVQLAMAVELSIEAGSQSFS